MKDAKPRELSLIRLACALYACVFLGQAPAFAAVSGISASISASISDDVMTQNWASAYQKLRKSRRTTADYKEAAQAVNPAGASGQAAQSEVFMDPAKIPRVLTFGKNNDAQVVLPEAPRPEESVAPAPAAGATVIEFGK